MANIVSTNTFATTRPGLTSGASHIAVITPSNDDDLEYVTRAINASADCTVKIDTLGGETVTDYQLHKGYNPIFVTRVYATGTTLGGATLWALW